MFLLGLNVNAYIDPSTVSYAITAIAAVVISCGFAIGIIWRKLKHNVAEKILKIDENANKEVEDDIVIKDEEGEPDGNAPKTDDGNGNKNEYQ